MNWKQLLEHEIEDTFTTTANLIDKVEPGPLRLET